MIVPGCLRGKQCNFLYIPSGFVYNKAMEEIKTNERIDDLQWGGLKIIQDPNLFCFGTDSILLAWFTRVERGDTVADLGTGCGILSILIGGKNPKSHVYAVEIQKELFDMAKRSVALNGLKNITVVHGDLKNAPRIFPRCNVVVSNPPYDRVGAGKASPNKSRRIARQETLATFRDIARAAARLLGDGGRFYFIHRSKRTAEIFADLRSVHLTPKTARFIHTRVQEKAQYVLVCAVKNGREGLEVPPPLVVSDGDGNYTQEVAKIYGTDGMEEKDG